MALDAVGHRVRVVTWKSLAPLQAERGTLERAILLGIPMAVLLAIAGGLSIGRRALRPLTEMAAQAGAIGSHNLDARLAMTSPVDELGTLGHAFNQLLERLAAALQQQRVFMADASHQLRTPVSVIRTAAQVMLSREHRSEEEYRESLDVVARQAQRLTKSVEDMFILALADAQARPLHTAPLYFDELVGEVIDDLRVVAESRQVTLRGDFAGEAPLIGDEDLLRQMLANLIDNAIRHTPAGGTVTVSLTRSAAMLTVTVTDTGRGIADRRHRPHLRAIRARRSARLGARRRPRPSDRPLDRRSARRHAAAGIDWCGRQPVRRDAARASNLTVHRPFIGRWPCCGVPVSHGSPSSPVGLLRTLLTTGAVSCTLIALGRAQAPPAVPLTLDAAVERAMAANPSVAAARLRRATTLGAVAVAGERPNPEVRLEFTRETPHEAYTFAVPLETAGKRDRRIAVGEAALGVGDAELVLTMIDLRAAVRRAYFARLVAESRLSLLAESQALTVRARDAAQQRFDAGSAPRLEVLQADLARSDAETQAIAAEGASVAARVRLNTLLGLTLR